MTYFRKKCVEVAKAIAKVRDKYICQRCNKKVSWHDCHWSHIIPESKNKYLSCEPENIKVLCYRCHKNRHENPIEAAKRVKSKRPERIERLIAENIIVRSSIWKDYFINRLVTLKKELQDISQI